MNETKNPNVENAEAIYAISNTGEILDFRALAAELASEQYANEFSTGVIMPIIPDDLEVAGDLSMPLKPIGNDDRVEVNNTTYFPWSTVVKIDGYLDGEQLDCSGWMLGPSTVVTAAHCIFDPADDKFAYMVVVTPGLNSNESDSMPFGSCEANLAWITNFWMDNGDEAYDYGVYALECRAGNQTGSLGFRTVSDSYIDEENVNVVGYPMSKGGTTMWYGLGNVVNTLPSFLYYDNDTSSGQSGSPVWELIPDVCPTCAVAIHSGPGVGEYNVGVRITDELFEFLIAMKQWEFGRAYLPLVMGSDEQESAPLEAPQDPYPAPKIEPKNEPLGPYPGP